MKLKPWQEEFLKNELAKVKIDNCINESIDYYANLILKKYIERKISVTNFTVPREYDVYNLFQFFDLVNEKDDLIKESYFTCYSKKFDCYFDHQKIVDKFNELKIRYEIKCVIQKSMIVIIPLILILITTYLLYIH